MLRLLAVFLANRDISQAQKVPQRHTEHGEQPDAFLHWLDQNPVEWTQVTMRAITNPAVRSRPNTARQKNAVLNQLLEKTLPGKEDSPGLPGPTRIQGKSESA